jgi:hypothetical protein
MSSASIGKIYDPLIGDPMDAARDSARAQEQALERAIEEQRRAAEQGLGFLQPFGDVGQRAIDLSSFLGDSQAQFDFLQDNPLFQLALDNANQQTNAQAAARGRLSAGDTLQQLSNNVLLSAQPLIDRQRSDIFNMLNLGTGIAQSQANTALGVGSNVSGLLTDIGAVQAGGIMGASNAQQQGIGNILNIAAMASQFSDSRLKKNAEKIGSKNGYDLWSWEWNNIAKKLFNLTGKGEGVMLSDVLEKNPEAVSYVDGYGKVNYTAIGVI